MASSRVSLFRGLSAHFLATYGSKNAQYRIAVKRWHKCITQLAALGSISTGNKLTIMRDGDMVFQELWKSLSQATKKVYMEMYTIEADNVGHRTLQHLNQARKSGSDVVVVCDGLGSPRATDSFFSSLKSAGGFIHKFNPMVLPFPWKWTKFRGLFRRNHRKIVSIDQKVGYIGGMNISEKYAGYKTGGTAYFRDTHVKVEGPAVTHLTSVTNNTVDSLRGVKRGYSDRWYQSVAIPQSFFHPDGTSGVSLQVFNSTRRRREIQVAVSTLLKTACTNCNITTPYFLPPKWLRSAIAKAAQRGVQVRIITAGCSDVPIVRYASQHIYGKLLKSGVQIYELVGNNTLHSKTLTIDGLYSSVGSFNFDFWSGYNLETNLGILDKKTARIIEEQFKDDKRNSIEIYPKLLEERSYLQKAFHWLCYFALTLMSPPLYWLKPPNIRTLSNKLLQSKARNMRVLKMKLNNFRLKLRRKTTDNDGVI